MRWALFSGAIGVGGLALAMLGWWLEPRDFHFAWLSALSVWVGWPLGSLVLLLIQDLAGGRWVGPLRRPLLAGLATLPLLLPAVVPLVYGVPELYPWVRGVVPNAFYLNLPFLAARAVFYLIAWFALGALMLGDRRSGRLAGPGLAGPGLAMMALTMTFAAIDTTMSLDPAYNSSVYGMIAVVGSVLLALSVATAAAAVAGPRAALPDLSAIVLGVVVLWAYLAFVQFLIVWESDLGHEARWYAQRSTGVWGIVAAVLAVGNLLVPFAALLVRAVRRSRIGIAMLCGWLVAMAMLRGWWLVLPEAHRAPGWIDIACMAALFGLGSAGCAFATRRAAVNV